MGTSIYCHESRLHRDARRERSPDRSGSTMQLRTYKGSFIYCRERLEYKADGARDTGVYTEYMRISSTD